MATRTLDVALWDYQDEQGHWRRAFHGDTFELPDEEVERGERANVFAIAPEGFPTLVATKPVLIAWLVKHRGADAEAIGKLTKDALWELIT